LERRQFLGLIGGHSDESNDFLRCPPTNNESDKGTEAGQSTYSCFWHLHWIVEWRSLVLSCCLLH
jgi:hypothetical protein